MKKTYLALALSVTMGLSMPMPDWIYNYDYSDNVAPSQEPPAGLRPDQVPMFVTIGFDDNSRSGLPKKETDPVPDYPEGMLWALEYFRTITNPAGTGNPATFDGTPVRVAFYNTTYYAAGYNGDNPALIRRMWNKLYKDGHEIGNHTHTHSENLVRGTAEVWANEVETCMSWMERPLAPDDMPLWQQAESDEFGSGIPRKDVVGFRTPFLAYGGPLFPVLKDKGLIYDCTIEEGNHWTHDGTNFRWPYTLNNGSPGHTEGWSGNPDNPNHFTVPPVDGFWQLPNHVAMIPSKEEAAAYGINHCIRSVIAENISWFNPESVKMTLFDYNMWAQAELSNEEVLAILKFTFDKRLEGNRAPLMIGAHSEYFHSDKDKSCPNATDTRGRQKVFEEFLEYALSHPMVRVVRPIDIITWMRDPVALGGETSIVDNSVSANSIKPVVADNRIVIDMVNAASSTVNLQLISPNGRLVSAQSVRVASDGLVEWSYGALSPGLYILQIDNGVGHRLLIQ